VKGDEDD